MASSSISLGALPLATTSALVRRYLLEFADLYPGIDAWYDKVELEAKKGERSLIAAFDHRDLVGLAITKNGKQTSKLCHVSVAPPARGSGVGRCLMRVALCEMTKCGASDLTVTTNEKIAQSYGEFFRRAGFEVIDWQVSRYQPGVAELIWKRGPLWARRSHMSWPNQEVGKAIGLSRVV